MAATTITLETLLLDVIVGIREREQRTPQPLSIDLTLHVPTLAAAGVSGDLSLSVNYAATAKQAELGIARDDGRVHFAQILGMADDVTGALAAAGHNAHKLALFGGLEHILPWLMRRLDENVGMLAATAGERALLLREIRRRLAA